MTSLIGSETLPNWTDLPDILTVPEAAAFLRVTKAGIYEAIKLGILPAVNAGVRRTRISKLALEKVFNSNVEGASLTAAFGQTPEVDK